MYSCINTIEGFCVSGHVCVFCVFGNAHMTSTHSYFKWAGRFTQFNCSVHLSCFASLICLWELFDLHTVFSHVCVFVCVLQIFYKVTREIFPGEELLLFMKAEDYSYESMAPDIHGSCAHTPWTRPEQHTHSLHTDVHDVLTFLPPTMQRRDSTAVKTVTNTLSPAASCWTTRSSRVGCPLPLS